MFQFTLPLLLQLLLGGRLRLRLRTRMLIIPQIHVHRLLVIKDVVKLFISKSIPLNRLPQNLTLSALDSQQPMH
jgi:hypothetical protein